MGVSFFFFFNETATTEIYTLSLHDALPISDDELRALALAGLRADLTALAGYRHHLQPPLACPVAALGGDRDAVRPEQLAAWGEYTTGGMSLRIFPGGHFYFRDGEAEVLDHLGRWLAGVV